VLRIGRGGGGTGLRESTNALADAVEALIAAAYVEAGLEAARRLSEVIVQHGMALAGPLALRDAKSQLQERLQALGEAAPQYELLETSGPSHEPHFRVRVTGGGGVLGEGDGRSKRVAEQAAATVALQRLPAPGSEPPRSGRAGLRLK